MVYKKVINWDFDLAISVHGGIGADPKILYEKTIQVPGSKPSPKTARYNKSEELNECFDGLMHEMDASKRLEAVHEAQNVYARELPAISLYYPTWYYAYNPEAGVEWFYTIGGIAKGIPIPQNKLALIGTGTEESTTAAIPKAQQQESPIISFSVVIAILILVAVYLRRH